MLPGDTPQTAICVSFAVTHAAAPHTTVTTRQAAVTTRSVSQDVNCEGEVAEATASHDSRALRLFSREGDLFLKNKIKGI